MQAVYIHMNSLSTTIGNKYFPILPSFLLFGRVFTIVHLFIQKQSFHNLQTGEKYLQMMQPTRA